MLKPGFLIPVALALGCGASNNSVSVDNMNPLGSVGGVVVDAATEMPLTGATVTLVSGGTTLTAMTNGMGLYTLNKVPAGSFTMTVSQMGYQTALVNDSLDGAVGNFPVSNPSHTVQQIGLIPNSGMFTVQLLDDSGSPVPMVKLTAHTNVREILYSNGSPVTSGSYTVEATTGSDGTATFMSLPAYATLGASVDDTVTVTVPPILTMGNYTFLGLIVPYHLESLQPGANGLVQTINIVGPSAPLAVVDSNLSYLKGKAGPNATTPFTAPTGSIIGTMGPITIAFNQAINGSSLRAQLLDENAAPLATTLTPTVTTNLLSLVPSAALSPGTRYNLVLHAVAAAAPGPAMPSNEFGVVAPFFTAPPSTPVGVTAQLISNATAVYVDITFSEPVGFGFGSGASIDCAAFWAVPGSTGFNNSSSSVYQCDWKTITGVSTPPQNLVCRQPLGAPSGPYLDVTQISPLESTNGGMTLLTGFSDKWQVQVDTVSSPPQPMSGPCQYNTACTKIGTGTMLHLIFSRQTGMTVKRVDGTPVPDNLQATIM